MYYLFKKMNLINKILFYFLYKHIPIRIKYYLICYLYVSDKYLFFILISSPIIYNIIRIQNKNIIIYIIHFCRKLELRDILYLDNKMLK